MNRSSIFRKTIVFSKSSGSYLVDSKSGNEYLDFFGQYSTLAIGYNHPIFKTSYYLDEIKRIAHQKITNCEILSEESDEFNSIFKNYTSKGNFSHYHYCCTGALAIEAAKTNRLVELFNLVLARSGSNEIEIKVFLLKIYWRFRLS